MRILVSEKLSENRFKTPEGYLICTNAILARTGKQTYLRREVFGDSCNDADKEVEVDRTAEEVFAPETLASFENKPLCVEHPDEDVNAENHNLLSVGYVRDVKKDVVDGKEVMTATLVITDKYGIDEVESGRKTDLSCGYDCDIIDDEHPQQRHIRGNHVAICERGRAGIARIVDSTPPRGYKVTGNNYAWELAGTAKDKKEAANKFVRKYPELDDIWGISELLNFMIQSNKDVERDTELGYALHFDYDEDTKKFYIAFVEKKYRYDDSAKDAQHQFEVCYIDYDKRCVVIEANSTDDAVTKFRRKYGMYHIVHVKQIDSMKNMEDNMDDAFNPGDKIEHPEGDAEVIDKIIYESTFSGKKVKKYVMKSGRKYLAEDINKSWRKVNDNMKKYAEDKHGRTFTLEEIEGGKVKATNMGGREKIFSGWKEAEEEFGKRGIAILDSFYDIVEDSVKDEDRLWRVYLTGSSGVNNIMYVKADNEAMARKIAERNTDEEIIRITEYGNTPLAKIDKERILRNPNKYFDSEKKIEKIAKIVSKLK